MNTLGQVIENNEDEDVVVSYSSNGLARRVTLGAREQVVIPFDAKVSHVAFLDRLHPARILIRERQPKESAI